MALEQELTEMDTIYRNGKIRYVSTAVDNERIMLLFCINPALNELQLMRIIYIIKQPLFVNNDRF